MAERHFWITAHWMRNVSYSFQGSLEQSFAAWFVNRFSKYWLTKYSNADLVIHFQAAFVGGVVAQEIVKQAGKYTPLSQWLHWDDLALAAPDLSDTVNTLPSRYSHQISIFGKVSFDIFCALVPIAALRIQRK